VLVVSNQKRLCFQRLDADECVQPFDLQWYQRNEEPANRHLPPVEYAAHYHFFSTEVTRTLRFASFAIEDCY